MAEQVVVNKNFNGAFEIIIKHQLENGYELQRPVVRDGVQWETEAKGAPGKLTFKAYKDNSGNLNFQEGDLVALRYKDSEQGWTVLFSGYIFSKTRSKDNWIDVTAYDQMRYLKNKATYVYTNKKASEVVKMIAEDYHLTIGEIEDTDFVIGSRVEDDQSLLDIIQNAIDLTLIGTGTKYVLYDDCGKLYLQNVEKLKTNLVINELTAEDFDYKSSIDEKTYNEIELYYDNDKTNKREYYNIYNPDTMHNWGRLRYTESIDNPTNAKNRVHQLLKLYNRKNREVKIKKAFGDCRCRGGASVIANLMLGDIEVNTYAFIESATHVFSDGHYSMNLTLTVNSNEEYNSTNEVYTERNIVEVIENTETIPSSGVSVPNVINNYYIAETPKLPEVQTPELPKLELPNVKDRTIEISWNKLEEPGYKYMKLKITYTPSGRFKQETRTYNWSNSRNSFHATDTTGKITLKAAYGTDVTVLFYRVYNDFIIGASSIIKDNELYSWDASTKMLSTIGVCTTKAFSDKKLYLLAVPN